MKDWENIYGQLSTEEIDFLLNSFDDYQPEGTHLLIRRQVLDELDEDDMKKFPDLIKALRKATPGDDDFIIVEIS